MRYLLLAVLSFSVLAQDNSQSFSVTAGIPFQFTTLDHTEGRGTTEWPYMHRYWYSDGKCVQTYCQRMLGGSGAGAYQLFDPIFTAANNVMEKPYYIGTLIPGLFPDGAYGRFEFTASALNGTLTYVSPNNHDSTTVNAGAFQPNDNLKGPDFIYRSNVGFTGVDIATIVFKDGANGSVVSTTTIVFTIPNRVPEVSLSASPSLSLVGGTVLLSSTASDPDGQDPAVTYDFGDGTISGALSHVYTTAGVYTITATANDGYGGINTAYVDITVVSAAEHAPTARITTSDIVAFANVPFVVDGITSTDPQNKITGYTWDFGDGTPSGINATLSHIFTTMGTRLIKLTVEDTEGFTSVAMLEIEVLEESAAATFSSEITTTATYFPQKQNRDTLTVFARVNIGRVDLLMGDTVSITYAGVTFSAILDKRLRADGWVIKRNLRKQAPGTVEVSIRVRNASLTAALSALGAEDDVAFDVPLTLVLAEKTIEVQVPTEFEATATRGKALGQF